MFLLDCPACGHRELRSTRSLTSFTNTARGIELTMTCSRCGTVVHELMGARASGPGCPVAEPADPRGAAA